MFAEQREGESRESAPPIEILALEDRTWPYGPLSSEELAYLAGVVDGEGTIGIYRQGPAGTAHFDLKLIVTNSSIALIRWVHARIGGAIVFRPSANLAYRDMFYLVIVQRRAAEVIRACRPYLIVKTPQADLALRFIDDAVFDKGRRVSDAEREKRRRYSEEMMSFNRPTRRRDEAAAATAQQVGSREES